MTEPKAPVVDIEELERRIDGWHSMFIKVAELSALIAEVRELRAKQAERDSCKRCGEEPHGHPSYCRVSDGDE